MNREMNVWRGADNSDVADKKAIDLFRQELGLLIEYIDFVGAPRTEFLVSHCEVLLAYAREADEVAVPPLGIAA